MIQGLFVGLPETIKNGPDGMICIFIYVFINLVIGTFYSLNYYSSYHKGGINHIGEEGEYLLQAYKDLPDSEDLEGSQLYNSYLPGRDNYFDDEGQLLHSSVHSINDFSKTLQNKSDVPDWLTNNINKNSKIKGAFNTVKNFDMAAWKESNYTTIEIIEGPQLEDRESKMIIDLSKMIDDHEGEERALEYIRFKATQEDLQEIIKAC